MRPKLAKLRIGGDCWMHLEPERVSAVNAPDPISVKSDVMTCEDAGQSWNQWSTIVDFSSCKAIFRSITAQIVSDL